MALAGVAGCGENRESGSEWEGWEVIPSSTPNLKRIEKLEVRFV